MINESLEDFLQSDKVALKDGIHVAIPIEVAHLHVDLWQDAYGLRLGDGKLVTIERVSEDLERTFAGYKQKGVTHLWLQEHKAQAFLARIKNKLKIQLKQEAQSGQSDEKNILKLDDAYDVVKKMLQQAGMEEGALEMALEMNRQIVEKFHADQKLVALLRQMRNRCNEQFLKNLYASILIQGMAQQFSWYSTAIIERMVMAIMLGDILLSNRDYQLMKAGEWEALNQEALMYPLTTARLFGRSKKFAHPEIITIIEQHREWPNGKGFPKQLQASQIHFLSAFVITAKAFVDLEFATNFAPELKYQNLENVYRELFEGSSSKHFMEAVSGLFKALGLTFPANEIP